MKEIVGYLVFQTEILDGLTLWHGIRFVADEQPLEITAAVHTFNRFCYSSEGHIFYSLEQYVKIGCLLYNVKIQLYILNTLSITGAMS